jgi:NAD(P)H-hydrate epimerase
MLRLTRTQARALDRLASEAHGLAGCVLMENAGLLAALEIERIYRESALTRPGPVIVFCGGGNNGGDGFVIARQLQTRDVPVRVECTQGERGGQGDAQRNRHSAQSLGVNIHRVELGDDADVCPPAWSGASVFVDALLGTGFQGPMRDPMACLITAINRARTAEGVPTVSIDLPSGLDCDLGQAAAATIEADWTLTFAAEKVGFVTTEARPYLGQVKVLPIGLSPARVLGEQGS